MAHFAKIDENNIVQEVIVVSNSDCQNLSFPESETIGLAFLSSIGLGENWKQTSYIKSFRKNFASIGYSYDESRDAFISSKPYPSWILNEDTCCWKAPVPLPDHIHTYIWDEENQMWIQEQDL